MVSRAASRLADAVRPTISRAELATKLGVSRQAVAGWLAGDFQPSPDLMAKIEDLVGIPMRDWTEPPDEAAKGAA